MDISKFQPLIEYYGEKPMDISKFQPLFEYYGEKSPNAGQLIMLCMNTQKKELFMPAVAAFFHLLNKIDIDKKDKLKILRKIEERMEQFN